MCANVLSAYIQENAIVPWDDLRYIFGEIMYGGHITDAWDRRTNNTYLAVYLKPEILVRHTALCLFSPFLCRVCTTLPCAEGDATCSRL